MAYWWVREWAGFWMVISIITSLTLTQPSLSTRKTTGHSNKGSELDTTKPNMNLVRLGTELEEGRV